MFAGTAIARVTSELVYARDLFEEYLFLLPDKLFPSKSTAP
jgi:hypothetical protein